MARGGRKTSDNLIVDENKIIRKINRTVLPVNNAFDITSEMLNAKVPIHLGGVSDPFSNQVTTSKSLKLLKSLGESNYPIIISTKNTDELTKDKTLKILKKCKNIVIQVSFIHPSNDIARIVEPNAPIPEDRLKGLEFLSKENFHTIARLQPLFIPWIDHIEKDLIPSLGSIGCRHVIVEFLKLPVEKKVWLVEEMFKQISWNGFDFYKEAGAELVGREWILPNHYKWKLLQPIIRAIHNSGMTYGAADYGLTHLGDTDCCCGIDKLDGFSSWFKANFSYIIKQSIYGDLSFNDVLKYWLPDKSISMYVNSHSRLQDGKTVFDYLKNKWNRPGTSNAPDTFLGVSWNGSFDQNGNCIYHKGNIPDY